MPDRLVFNGIDATTGSYLLPSLSLQELSKLAQGQSIEPAHLDELRWRHTRASEATLGPAAGIDPRDMADAGWGMVVTADVGPDVLEALQPLCELRRRQATHRHERRFRIFADEHAYRAGETKQEFLARHGAGPGPVDPDRVPYYLLLVGDAEAIPYQFQYQLDVQYAVGRIHFEHIEDYARYAAAVVAAETEPSAQPHTVHFFAPRNPGDPATELSMKALVAPLADGVQTEHADWAVGRSFGDAASKSRLIELLGGAATPSILFTASHGIGFPSGHPAQRSHQGALVCQDWQGPATAIDETAYVSAEDIPSDAALGGLIAFHFACFGAGTPTLETYPDRDGGPRRRLAPTAFVAALPQRLLALQRGGALAVVGHIERAWGYSFTWPGVGRQTQVYRSTLERLLDGHPIGSAFEYFNERYAELAADLSDTLDRISYGMRPDHQALAAMWTSTNDARGFAVLGDPAVRLRTSPTADARSTASHDRRVVSASGVTAPDGFVTVPPAPQRLHGSDEEPDRIPTADAETEFGLMDGMREARQRLAASVQHLAVTLADILERAAESVAIVEVATYTSDDLSKVAYDREAKRFEGARLRALARASVAGDLQLLVPEDQPVGDELWSLHVAMVEQAQRTRTELLRSAGQAVSGLFDALGPRS